MTIRDRYESTTPTVSIDGKAFQHDCVSASVAYMSDTDNISRRQLLQATGGAAAATTVAGCLGGSSTEPDNQSSQQIEEVDIEGTTLDRILSGTITTMDPIAATDVSSGEVITQIFDTLLYYQNGTTTVEPLLVDSVELSEDFRTYTFTLRDDATFHDGRDVTAQDVVYSFERLAASDNSRRAGFLLDDLGVVHETETVTQDGEEQEVYRPGSMAVEAVDDATVELTLTAPFHAAEEMLSYSSFSILPEGVVGDIEGYEGEMEYEEFASSNPIGSGPFRFERWNSGVGAAVSANEDYHRESPAVDGVTWQIIEKDPARFNYAMNKNADLFGIPTTKYDPDLKTVESTDDIGREVGTYGPVRNGETLNYTGVPTINTYYIGFNMEAVPKPVRQAVGYVLNQQQIVREVFKNRGQPAFHLTPPSIFPGGQEQYSQRAETGFPYGHNESRLDRARQLMEEAGYSEDEPFTLNWTQYQSDTWKQAAQILRRQLGSVHITLEINEADFSTLLKRGRNGNLEAYTLGWIADWPAPDNFLALLNPPQTQTDQPGPVSYINWGPDTGDAAQQATTAYERVAGSQDPSEAAQQTRNEAYLEIEDANWEDAGILPLYHSVDEYFWYDRIDYDPFGGMGISRQRFTDVSK